MTAYVHLNIRVLDPARQAALAPQFKRAVAEANGRLLYFGRVVDTLEGDVHPLPMAGIVEFPTVAQALQFYNSEAYAPIKAERAEVQEARIFVVEANPIPSTS